MTLGIMRLREEQHTIGLCEIRKGMLSTCLFFSFYTASFIE